MKNSVRFALVAVTASWISASAQAAPAAPKKKSPPPPPPAPSPWQMPEEEAPAPELVASAAPVAAAPAPVVAGFVPGIPSYRPTGRSIGIGAGWNLPADLGTPNEVSARIRMASGFAIEPTAKLQVGNTTSKVDDAKVKSTGSDLGFGAALRKPFVGRSQCDIVLIGAANFDAATTSGKNEEGAKVTDSLTTIGASWGVGVELFPRGHWSISFDAMSPVAVMATTVNKVGDVKTTTTSTSFGLVLDPTVRLMSHIYY